MGIVAGVKFRVDGYGDLRVLEANVMRIRLTFSVAKQIKVFLCVRKCW